jgi:uncharacterized protein (TIGR03435 family)
VKIFVVISVTLVAGWIQPPAYAQPFSPAFDVAAIKINAAGRYIAGDHILPSGRFTFSNATLRELVMWAYHVQLQFVTGGAGWLDGERYDIVANAPKGTTIAGARLMLRALLAERFELVVREENKVIPVYVLIVGNKGPHLTRSLAATSGHCGRSPRPEKEGMNGIKCSNLTLSEFAEYLPDLAPQYVDRPVVNMTGVEGSYDFELEYSRTDSVRQPGGNDPSAFGGDNPIFDALSEHFGLKLEKKKQSMPSVVVEHVLRRPTEN